MEINREALSHLCHRHGIVRLRLFGSFARGDAGAGSDIDLLAEFDGRKSLLDLARIEREFAEHFGREVDLHTLASLSPYLRDPILREARVVYELAA